jgi:hypothetical protein
MDCFGDIIRTNSQHRALIFKVLHQEGSNIGNTMFPRENTRTTVPSTLNLPFRYFEAVKASLRAESIDRIETLSLLRTIFALSKLLLGIQLEANTRIVSSADILRFVENSVRVLELEM